MSPSASPAVTAPPLSSLHHRLDGLTLLRFAHAYESGGGVEMHLRDLNHGLSRRNSFTTILVHLTKERAPVEWRRQQVGGSTLITVPLQATASTHGAAASTGHGPPSLLRKWVIRATDFFLFAPLLNWIVVRTLLRWRPIPQRTGEALQAGPAIRELIRQHNVDLVVLHANGGADASEVIAAAKSAQVPIALIHHFSNDKFGNVSVRQQVAEVQSVAGASSVDLPFYVRRNFTNLSDAVDLDFFSRRNASPVPVRFSTPVLFAPGRLTPEKGQMDALTVMVNLHRHGLKVTLILAGRVDDPDFERLLRERAHGAGLADYVHFAGELTLSQYRDWFAVAHLTLMPTYHREGMPRTLIDSQAMQVPPLVYNVGGTRDGVRHDQTGFLIRLGDVAAMTAHAEDLLRRTLRRDQMAANGRAFVEAQFSLEAFLARHESYYLDTISRLPRRRSQA